MPYPLFCYLVSRSPIVITPDTLRPKAVNNRQVESVKAFEIKISLILFINLFTNTSV